MLKKLHSRQHRDHRHQQCDNALSTWYGCVPARSYVRHRSSKKKQKKHCPVNVSDRQPPKRVRAIPAHQSPMQSTRPHSLRTKLKMNDADDVISGNYYGNHFFGFWFSFPRWRLFFPATPQHSVSPRLPLRPGLPLARINSSALHMHQFKWLILIHYDSCHLRISLLTN